MYIEVDGIDDFVRAVYVALDRWLRIHADAQTWADEWTAGEPLSFVREICNVRRAPGRDLKPGYFGNAYFEYNLYKRIVELYAREQDDLIECSACGEICDRYGDCDCDEHEYVRPDTQRVIEFMLDVFPPDRADSYEWISEALAWNALVDAHAHYYEEVCRQTSLASCVDECSEALRALRDAQTPADQLARALWATRVQHVHGEIARDWIDETSSLSSEDIDDIREHGIGVRFTKYEIEQFLAGERVDLQEAT